MALGGSLRSGMEREDYDERRRKWRRSGFWRGVLVVLAILAVLIGIGVASSGLTRLSPHIAVVDIGGVITQDPIRDAMLKTITEDKNVKGVVLRISSPGGTTVGSEALFARLRALSAEKPVVATVGEVAASGGYIAAMGADHIVAWGNSITGSIGVILEYPQFTELMERLGIDVQTVRSSELKGGPSPFRPTSPEMLALEEELIEESYLWFRGIVADRRGLNGAALDSVADGRIFTGRLALNVGLIDEIGGYDAAVAWLEARDSVDADLPQELYVPDYPEQGFLGPVANFLTKSTGLEFFPSLSGPRLTSLAR
ncbi:MAG: signal peptide peptidase SppA [Pseudomonadota bacterium]